MNVYFENVKKNFVPLSDKEQKAVTKVREIFRAQGLIPCTACRYCTDGCPKQKKAVGHPIVSSAASVSKLAHSTCRSGR